MHRTIIATLLGGGLCFVARPPAHAEELPSPEQRDSVGEAILGGKVSLDLRLRFEYADIDGTGWGHAETARLRFGYGTKPIQGLSAYGELETVVRADGSTYNDSLNGQVNRALIADPEVFELNQLYGKYDADGLTLIGGRQRITLDDQRFIGNVGWRQDEQTFDAASIRYRGFQDTAILGKTAFYYAYLWKINRIFAQKMDFDSDSHLVNIAYDGLEFGKIILFGYLLDFRGDSPINDGKTFGVRLVGDRPIGGDCKFGYILSYAHQTDAGPAAAFDADYRLVETSLTKKSWNTTLGVGYESLGSDRGLYGFRTPLATLHAFQGFADAFLVTPPGGIDDFYCFLGCKLPLDIQGKIIGHFFCQQRGGDDLGYEFDAVASKSITSWMSVTAKVAYFNGEESTPAAPADRVRFSIQLDFQY